MRKLVMLLLVVSSFATAAHAQNEAKAKAILADVSKKYKSYDVVSAKFRMTLSNAKAKLNESQSGTLLAKASANKYKVTMTNQELLSDGKSQWIYLKRDNEVQVNSVNNSSDGLNPAQIFTIYEKGFKYAYAGTSKLNGKDVHVINLTPTDSKKAISRVVLNVDVAAKQISRVIMNDKSGSVYTYLVESFTPNVKATDASFVFDVKKYPGVEVVDLR